MIAASFLLGSCDSKLLLTLLGNLDGFLVEFLPRKQPLPIPDWGQTGCIEDLIELIKIFLQVFRLQLFSELLNPGRLLKGAFPIYLMNDCVNSVCFSQAF